MSTTAPAIGEYDDDPAFYEDAAKGILRGVAARIARTDPGLAPTVDTIKWVQAMSSFALAHASLAQSLRAKEACERDAAVDAEWRQGLLGWRG